MKKVINFLVIICLCINLSANISRAESPALEFTFDSANIQNGTLYGNAEVENGVLSLDGTAGTYFALPKGCVDYQDEVTIAFDLYSTHTSTHFFTFAIGNNNDDYFFLRTRNDAVRAVISTSSYWAEEGVDAPLDNINNSWHHFVVVISKDSISVYVDGELAGRETVTKTISDLGSNLSVNFGKSTYSADPYFKGKFDNIKLYNRAFGEDEVKNMVSTEEKFNFDVNSVDFLNKDEITYDLDLKTKGDRSNCDIAWKSSDENTVTTDGRVVRGEVDKKVTLTATFTLDKLTAEKVFEVTVLGKEQNTAYLFAYFTGNNPDQERLFYGVSRDGYNFRALNGGKSVLTSTLGTSCIRDPFIMKGEDGYYYIIATDMRSSWGWSSNYATVVYKTPDLINIVDSEWINYREFPSMKNCTRAWAPQAIWCPEKNAYMIYLAMQTPDDPYATVMYRHYASNLCDASTYTDPELMLDEPYAGAAAIDGDIIYDKFHDKYIMYYCGKRVSECDTLSGEWKHVNTKYADGQVPMYTQKGVSMDVEGSNIWQITDEDKWVIAADGTPFNGGVYAVVETTDFENYTQKWSHNGDYSFDFTPRHGYVIPITERELNKLFDFYGKVELKDKTAYFINDSKAHFFAEKESDAIIAIYNEEHILTDCIIQPVSGVKEIEFTPPEKGEVKLLLLDEMKPLCSVVYKKYQGVLQ